MGKFRKLILDARRRRALPNAALYIVAAWVAIQVADLAIEAGFIRWALRDVFFAAFLGFPVALIVGWYYDITRHGLVRTAPVGEDPSFDGSLRVRDYLLFVSLAVVWVVAVILVHAPLREDRSIAILPFENPGHDPDNAIFGFGLRVDLHTQLQTVYDLKIVARESSDQVDEDLSLREIGVRLGAAYVMRGSVERILDRVRVNVVLINADDEKQEWAGSFDRELTAGNWFDIRNEISRIVTSRLEAGLSPQQQQRMDAPPTENMAALQAYFRGKQRMARRTTQSLSEAVGHFQRAVDLDPEFALAWVGLADSTYLDMLYGGLDEEEELPKIEKAVNKALALDDELGEAHASLAVLQRMRGRDDLAALSFRRSIELNPNYATARQWYGSTLVSLGRAEEGLAQKRKALELNPLSAIVNLSAGMTLARLARFDEALVHYEAAVELDPAMPGPYERIADLHQSAFGQLDEAVAWQTKGVALDPEDPMGPIYLGSIYLDLGDPVRAERWFDRSAALAPPGSPFAVAILEPLYIFTGDEARALEAARVSHEVFGPDAVGTMAHLRNHDLRSGDYAKARARYRQGYPELFAEDAPTITEENYEAAIDLALVLIRSGERDRADLLLDRSLAFIGSMHRLGPSGYGIADVLIFAMRGKSEAALSALRKAIDDGWRTSWWFHLENNPNLDSIQSDPRFQSMLAEIKADMASQLARVRAMEADGRLETVPEIR